MITIDRGLLSLRNTLEGLADIRDNIIDIFNASGYPHKISTDTGRRQFRLVQLTVSGRCRVTGQRLGITNVDETKNHLQRIDELRTCP